MPSKRIYITLPDGFTMAALRLAYKINPSHPRLSVFVADMLLQHIQNKIKQKVIPPISEEDKEMDRTLTFSQKLEIIRQENDQTR